MADVNDIQNRKIGIAIQKLSPSDGDIFTLQIPITVSMDQMGEFAKQLQSELPDGVKLLVMREDITIGIIPEADLNEMGYFRNVH